MRTLWHRIRIRAGWTSPRNDDGISLAEVLVAMVVAGLLGSAVVASISMMARQSTTTNARVLATNAAQIQMDRITHYLRSAWPYGTPTPSAFTTASASDAVFYADLGDTAGPNKVELKIVNGHLQESIWKQTGTPPSYAWSSTPLTRTDPGTLTSSSVFSYLNASGGVLAFPVTNLASIQSVVVTLTDQEAGLSDPVSVSTTVVLRSKEYQ